MRDLVRDDPADAFAKMILVPRVTLNVGPIQGDRVGKNAGVVPSPISQGNPAVQTEQPGLVRWRLILDHNLHVLGGSTLLRPINW